MDVGVLVERVRGLVADVAEVKREQDRTRERLHNLEGGLQSILAYNRLAMDAAEQTRKRLITWAQVLTFVVLVASIVVPVLTR